MNYAVVDVANLVERIRYVVRGDAFDQAGMALHIVFRSLRKLVREYQCGHVVLCLEGKNTWRRGVYPQYKSKRRADRKLKESTKSQREREDDAFFYEVIDQFKQFMADKTNVTVLQHDDLEGDDLIARWVQLHPQAHHYILSGDSDFVQLISDNVSLYNGVEDRLLTKDGAFDGSTKEPLWFEIESSSGKIKVKGVISKIIEKHNDEERKKSKRIEGYTPEPLEFSIEEDWIEKALFVKLIRGDSGDSVFSAYPGVRYRGSSKKVGICEAWDDRKGKNFHWNNFMLHRWEKLIGVDDQGNKITTPTRVLDEYEVNRMLIDLTKQPQEIKDLMDSVIISAVQKEEPKAIGQEFLKFCKAHALNDLISEINDHAKYLTARYA